MFFKQRIGGNEFGRYLAGLTDATAQKLDAQLERRLGRGGDPLFNDIEIAQQLDVRIVNSVLNRREFSLVWIYSLKELICLATRDRHVNKISSGFIDYIFDEYGDDDDDGELFAAVKMILDRDGTLAQTGFLQPYDENATLDADERTGVSYEIARLIIDKSLLIDDLEENELHSLTNTLVVEFETMFRLGIHLYKGIKTT